MRVERNNKKKKISLQSLGQIGDMRVLLERNSGLKIFQLQRRKARKKGTFTRLFLDLHSLAVCRRHWSYHSFKVHLRRKMTAWVQGLVSLKSSIDIFPQLTSNLWHISGDLKRKGFFKIVNRQFCRTLFQCSFHAFSIAHILREENSDLCISLQTAKIH